MRHFIADVLREFSEVLDKGKTTLMETIDTHYLQGRGFLESSCLRLVGKWMQFPSGDVFPSPFISHFYLQEMQGYLNK